VGSRAEKGVAAFGRFSGIFGTGDRNASYSVIKVNVEKTVAAF
jgi:hypothetical protein